MTLAHGHLKPVARRVEDYQNEILQCLLYSTPGGPTLCLYFFLLLLSICPVASVGWLCSWQPGGADAALGAPAAVMLPWWPPLERVRHGSWAGGDSAVLVQRGGMCSPQRACGRVLRVFS